MGGETNNNQGPASEPDAKPTPPQPRVEMLLDEDVNDRLDTEEWSFEDRAGELLSDDLDDVTLQQLSGAKGSRGEVGGLPSVSFDIPGSGKASESNPVDDTESDVTDQTKSANPIDALFQIARDRYAIGLINIVSNRTSDQAVRDLAMQRLSDALMRNHISDRTIAEDQLIHDPSAEGDELSEDQLEEQVATIARHHNDSDTRALAVAFLYRHELHLAGMGGSDRPLSPDYDASSESGTFHDRLVADLKKSLELPLPGYDYSDKESLTEFDARRKEKICACRALSYLEGGVGEGNFTQAINRALVSAIEFDDRGWMSSLRQHSEKPDIKATTVAVMMLIDRRGGLSEEQRSALRASSNAILDIDFDDRVESDKAQQGNADARHSKMLLIENLSKLYSGFNSKETTDHHRQYQDQKQVAEQILRELLISKQGWGKDSEMRGSAVRGLETFGPGLNDANIRAIAGRLDLAQREDEQVRVRAIQSLNSMTDRSIFRKSPEQLAKEGLPNLNVEHLLRTDSDPVAQATLLEIARESLSYRDPASFQAQVEASTYVNDLRAVDFVDVNESDIRSWLDNSRFQYLDQQTIAKDANRAAEKYNSGGWLGWNSVRAFFGHGTSKEFEGLKLEIDRDQQLQEMTDFQQLSDKDQRMAIHTLLHLCRDACQNLIKQNDEALFRTFAAKKLSQLAEISSANGDVVKDKRLLRAAVVMAFNSMPSDMPGEARMDLVKAVNSLTDRDFGRDLKSGDQPSDYTVITPQRAAALFRARLTKEAQNEAIALRTDAPAYRFDPTAGKYSEKVQLELIDSLYRLRDLGCYKELRERGPAPELEAGPASRGSRIDTVKNRAREVVEDLYYGVDWLREDSRKKGQGDSTTSSTGSGVSSQRSGIDTESGARTNRSIDGGASALVVSEIPEESAVRSNLTNDAMAIQSQLIADQQDRNFEPLTRMIFRSQKDYRIGGADDPRVGVLQQALRHQVERVRLAAANALSESALPPTSPEMIDARNTLYELANFGQRRVFQNEAGELLVAMKEREYGTDKIRTPAQLIHGVAWMAHTDRPRGGPAEMLERMQSAVTESEKDDDKSFDVLIDKKNALVKDSYNAAGLIVPITTEDDPRRTQLSQALESSDERVRFAAARVLHTSIIEGDRVSAEGPLKELESARESLSTVNQEALARAIITANFDSPITSINDPRRDFLIDSLEHGNERVELASAWIMAQSSLPDDREAAMKKLAVLAVHSAHEVGREEALTILSDITNYGNLEDQLFAYNVLMDVMVAKDGPSAVPPFSIPNEYSSAINYFERAPRTSLLTIFEDGSPTDLKNAIMAITGLDKEQLDRAIKSEYRSSIVSRQSGEQDFSAAATLSRGVKCASHRPEDKSELLFSEPALTDAQESKTLQSIVSKLIADDRQSSRTSSPNVRVRDMGSTIEHIESALKDFVGLLKDGQILTGHGLNDWSVLARTDRSPAWCKPHAEARTLPRWTPSHKIDPHNLFNIEAKVPGVLSVSAARSLNEEYGGAYSPRFARVAAQRTTDAHQTVAADEAAIENLEGGLAPFAPTEPDLVSEDALTDAEKTAPNVATTEDRQPAPSTTSADRISQPKGDEHRVESTGKRSKSASVLPSASTTQSPSQPIQKSAERPAVSEKTQSDNAAEKAASDAAYILEKLPREESTRDGDRNRTKLKSVFSELNDLFGRLPVNPAFNQPVDHQVLSDKISRRDFVGMTPAELQILMKLERDVPGFGEFTKFKATESIYKDVNQFLNTAVVESHDILHELKLSMGPGDPLGIVRIGTDPEHPDEGVPAHPDTISSLIKDGQLDVERFCKMAESGHLKSSLIFEPNGIPDSSNLDKMSNSFDWLYVNQVRVANSRNRIDANNQYKFLSNYLRIDKPNWAPDKVADKDLEAYNTRLRDVLNLTLQVRNTVEAMQSLDNVKGDFDPAKAFKDLQKLTVPGGFHFDQARKRVTELKLILPESLVGTSVNDKPIQDLKDWLVENRGPVDQAMDEYMRGEFIRYMDLHQKGVVGVRGDGDIAYVEDSNGPVAVFDPDNKLMINRGIDGATFFYQANPDGDGESRLPYGQEVSLEKVKELFARSKEMAVSKPFDYINQKFSVAEDGEYVNIQSFKTYYEDHALNYQHWFGTHQADSVDNRHLKFDQYIIAQGQTGREQLIRADRLREFQAIQAFFHHGSKFGSAALDFGMIITGGMSFGASLAAKSTTMALVNGGRIMLGVGGLLDPAFRQMGVTGDAVRTARHVIMIADVTQGLGRQGLAMVNGGKLLFESAKAAEVAKIIEASNTMRRTESAMRYVFGAADGVWLPLMGTEATHHIERMRGQNPSRYLERGLKDRGSPLGSELTQNPIATGQTADVLQSAGKVFSLYGDTINDTNARRIFDECLSALTADERSDMAAKYLQMFHPSADSLTEWRDQQYAGQWVPLKSVSARRIRPGDLKPEVVTDSKEKVAVAISLLYLAQQNGKLPADGVLVKREAHVGMSSFLHKPGLPTIRVGKDQEGDAESNSVNDDADVVMKRITDASVTAAKALAGIDIHVLPAEKVEQTVTTKDVIRVLREAAFDATSPATQMVAADALFRAGAMPAGRYAGTLLDVVNNKKSDRSIQEKAMKQLAGALMLKHIEETDPAMTVEQRAQKDADSFGLSEEHLSKFIETIAKQHENADVRALAVALLYEHELQLDDGIGNVQDNLLDRFDGGAEPGKFHDDLIADLKQTLELPMPPYRFSESHSLQEFDALRKEKVRAARALSHLEGGFGESNHTEAINAALVSTLEIPDDEWTSAQRLHSEKPNINLTMEAVMMLAERRNLIDQDQRSQLRSASSAIMEIAFDSRVESDIARRGNTDAYVAKMQVVDNLVKIFPGINYSDSAEHQSQYQEERQMVEQSLQEMLMTREGWGQFNPLRVAAIQGLEKFGPGLRDANVIKIANLLGAEVRDPYVRARAIQALSSITANSVFRASPAELAKRGLPNLNVEHMLRTESDPLAVATLLEIGQESLTYSDPASLRAEIESSIYVNDLRSVDFVDVTEKEIHEWLSDSRFQYVDQRAIKADANQATAAYNSGGWLEWKSARAFFGFGTSEEYESVKLEVGRDKQLEEMGDFQLLSQRDQQMAIHTLLHLCRDANQNLIKQEDEAVFRTFAARKLAHLAEVSADNSEIVKDRRLLRAAVVLAFDSMPSDMPGPARMHLIDALNSLTDRNFGKGSPSGSQPTDNTVITPQRAAALFRAQLTKEAENEALAHRPESPHYRFDPPDGKYSEKVQLALINSLYQLRDLGSFKELNERGCDPALDPSARGSRIDKVKQRARDVVEDLYYGVGWIREETANSVKTRAGIEDGVNRHDATGSGARTTSSVDTDVKSVPVPADSALRAQLDAEAASIESQLVENQQERNFEQLAFKIYRSQLDNQLGDTEDPRVAVLHHALRHSVERVQLAAAEALSQSRLPPDRKEMIDARDRLYALTEYGRRRIFQKEAGEVLVAMKEREYGTDKIGTPEQLIHGVAWMAHTVRPEGDQAVMLERMQNALTASKIELVSKNFDQLIDKKNPLVKHSYTSDGKVVAITSDNDTRRGKLLQALESEDERVRFAAAHVLRTSVIEQDRVSAEPELAMFESAKARLYTINQEAMARTIITANADSPIKLKEDPRRKLLLDAIDHDNERVALASAWMMSQSAMPLDRETAIRKLSHLAVHSSHEVGREEAMTILSDITSYGNLDDQLFAYNTLKDVMVARDGAGAVPPFAIPNEYSRAINYLERSPRSCLQSIREDGSLSELKDAIMAITGLSSVQLNAAIRAEYDNSIRPRMADGDFEAARMSALFSGVKCASHNPEHHKNPVRDFAEPALTETQQGQAVDLIVAKLVQSQAKLDSSNIRVRDLLSSDRLGDLRVQARIASLSDGKFEGLSMETDWTGLSQQDRRPPWSESEQAHNARTLPRWTPSHAIDAPDMNRLKVREHGVMSDQEASALFSGAGSLHDRASAKLAGSINADLKLLQALLKEEQPGNDRCVVEALYSTFKDQALVPYQPDPRRDVFKDVALNHKNDRVRLAAAWMLINSAARQDVADGTRAVAEMYVNGAISDTIRGEARALLEDMIFYGGDRERRHALDLWQDAYSSSGEKHEDRKPPDTKSLAVEDVGQARRYFRHLQETHSEYNLFSRSVEDKKAIVLQMHRAMNPDRPMSEAQLDARTMPSFIPLTGLSSTVFTGSPLSTNGGLYPSAPQDFFSGRRTSPYAPAIDTFLNSTRSGRTWPLSPQPGTERGLDGEKVGPVMAKWMRDNNYYGLEDAEFKFDPEKGSTFVVGVDERRVLSGNYDELTRFRESAPKEELAKFFMQLLKSRPEIRSSAGIKPEILADMYVQSLRGRPVEMISDTVADTTSPLSIGMPDQLWRSKLNPKEREAAVSSFDAVRKQRDTSHRLNLDWELGRLLDETPPVAPAFSARWKPTDPSSKKVDPPAVFRKPAIDQLELFRSHRSALLSQDLLEVATQNEGTIPISYLENFAHLHGGTASDGESIQVYPRLSSEVAGDYVIKDKSTWKVVNENQTRKLLRMFPIERKPDR